MALDRWNRLCIYSWTCILYKPWIEPHCGDVVTFNYIIIGTRMEKCHLPHQFRAHYKCIIFCHWVRWVNRKASISTASMYTWFQTEEVVCQPNDKHSTVIAMSCISFSIGFLFCNFHRFHMEIDIRSSDVQRRIQSIAHYIVRIVLYITIQRSEFIMRFSDEIGQVYSKSSWESELTESKIRFCVALRMECVFFYHGICLIRCKGQSSCHANGA